MSVRAAVLCPVSSESAPGHAWRAVPNSDPRGDATWKPSLLCYMAGSYNITHTNKTVLMSVPPCLTWVVCKFLQVWIQIMISKIPLKDRHLCFIKETCTAAVLIMICMKCFVTQSITSWPQMQTLAARPSCNFHGFLGFHKTMLAGFAVTGHCFLASAVPPAAANRSGPSGSAKHKLPLSCEPRTYSLRRLASAPDLQTSVRNNRVSISILVSYCNNCSI